MYKRQVLLSLTGSQASWGHSPRSSHPQRPRPEKWVSQTLGAMTEDDTLVGHCLETIARVKGARRRGHLHWRSWPFLEVTTNINKAGEGG